MPKTKSRFAVKFFERSSKSNHPFSETSALFIVKTLFETLFGYVNSNWKQRRFKILALNYFCGFSLSRLLKIIKPEGTSQKRQFGEKSITMDRLSLHVVVAVRDDCAN